MPKQNIDANGVAVAMPELPLRLLFAINNHFSILQINDIIYRFNKHDCKFFLIAKILKFLNLQN